MSKLSQVFEIEGSVPMIINQEVFTYCKIRRSTLISKNWMGLEKIIFHKDNYSIIGSMLHDAGNIFSHLENKQ